MKILLFQKTTRCNSCGREDFFFYLSGGGGDFFRLSPPKKYVIKCLIMLCIFVFTMGQLLRVHTGERTSAEYFKYWQT